MITEIAHLASKPPPKKKGWDHSKQVLVYYAACPKERILDKWGIAYYHYNPPFNGPQWVDFDNTDRIPAYWWELPTPPTATFPVASSTRR